MNIYFVYIYSHPATNVPFYVGYGKNDRHLDHLNEAIKRPIPCQKEHKLNEIRKILRDGLQPIIQIIDSKLPKEQACELEIFLISEIGRADKGEGPLTNLTMGGDGNRDWNPESRKEMSDRQKGVISAKDPITGELIRVKSDDPKWLNGELVGQNLGMLNLNKNGKLDGYILAKDSITEETFRVRRNDPRWLNGELVGINKNKPCPENVRLVASNTHKGVPKSEEHNKKNSDAMRKLKWFYNKKLDLVRRCIPGTQPEGFIAIIGPHKKITREEAGFQKLMQAELKIQRRLNSTHKARG